MNTYDDDYDDNEAWDGYTDDEDYDDEFDCGMVDDKRLCADAGTEHCSFFCPFHAWVMARNPDNYPLPEGYRYDDNNEVYMPSSDDNDDIPF